MPQMLNTRHGFRGWTATQTTSPTVNIRGQTSEASPNVNRLEYARPTERQAFTSPPSPVSPFPLLIVQVVDHVSNGGTRKVEKQPEDRTKLPEGSSLASVANVQDNSADNPGGVCSHARGGFRQDMIAGGPNSLQGTEPVLQRGCHMSVATFAKLVGATIEMSLSCSTSALAMASV